MLVYLFYKCRYNFIVNFILSCNAFYNVTFTARTRLVLRCDDDGDDCVATDQWLATTWCASGLRLVRTPTVYWSFDVPSRARQRIGAFGPPVVHLMALSLRT